MTVSLPEDPSDAAADESSQPNARSGDHDRREIPLIDVSGFLAGEAGAAE
jgi:hypothetical protein